MATSPYSPQCKEQVYHLLQLAQNGDQNARETLVIENTGLVKKIASKFSSWNHDIEDLIQIGYIGLIKAIDNFNPSYGVMFSTYAVPSIMGEIKRFIRDDGPIKISRTIKQDINKLKEVRGKIEQETGMSARLSQLSEESGFSIEYIREIMIASDNSAVASLDELYEERGEEGYSHMGIADQSDGWDDKIILDEQLVLLTPQERTIMLLRYYQDYTQSQVATRLGMSQVQVSRVEKRVIAKLRENLTQYSRQKDK